MPFDQNCALLRVGHGSLLILPLGCNVVHQQLTSQGLPSTASRLCAVSLLRTLECLQQPMPEEKSCPTHR